LIVDRVDGFERTGNHFEPKQGFDQTLCHSLGMTVNRDVPIENVVLEFEHIQGKFFASKPCKCWFIGLNLRVYFLLLYGYIKAGVKHNHQSCFLPFL